jgi:mono/diheme cytochrome c family protein
VKIIALCAALIAIAAVLSVYGGATQIASAASDGKALFETNCSTCHGSSGKGQPGVFPPLAGNTDETAKDPSTVIGIVLNGLNVPKTIMGKQYSGGMPSWSQLSDADIAAILTYVRHSWGNNAAPVSEKQVAAVRSKVKK